MLAGMRTQLGKEKGKTSSRNTRLKEACTDWAQETQTCSDTSEVPNQPVQAQAQSQGQELLQLHRQDRHRSTRRQHGLVAGALTGRPATPQH